jgi:hypothetical protein
MAYLDTILSAAMQGPSDDDKDTLRRLSRIAGSSNYNPTPDIAAQGPQNYSTPLSATEEPAFQNWLKTNQVPFKDEPQADYDMRGFYKAAQFGDPRATQSLNAGDQQMHFPDTWKTPYHTGFSNESMYAPQSAPRWEGDVLKTAGGKVVSDERPSQPQTPLGGYLGAIGAGTQSIQSAASKEEALPARNIPERSYPPAEGTGYQGFEVPAASPIAQRLAGIGEQEAALRYPGVDDISKKRRFLADLAGVATGIMTKNPMAGIQMAEGIKTQKFHQALSDLERQREALTPTLTEEQKRTTEAANIYKAERTADIGQQRADTGAGTLAEKVISDRRRADQLARNEDDINAHRAINENIATGKLLLTGTIAENRDKLARELEKEREIAAQKRTETMASAISGRTEATKEPSQDEKDAAENAYKIMSATDDPDVKERAASAISQKARDYLGAQHEDAFNYKKLPVASEQSLKGSRNTLDLIPEIVDVITKHPNAIGVALGRMNGIKGKIGTQDENTSYLEGLLNQLLISEASVPGARILKVVMDTIKEHGSAGLAQELPQFMGKLKAMEFAAKTNHRNITGKDYVRPSTEPDLKMRIIGPVPK